MDQEKIAAAFDRLDRLAQEYLDDDQLCDRPTQAQTVQLLMLREIRNILRRIETMLTVP